MKKDQHKEESKIKVYLVKVAIRDKEKFKNLTNRKNIRN